MGKNFNGVIPVTRSVNGRDSVSGNKKNVSGEISIGSFTRVGFAE